MTTSTGGRAATPARTPSGLPDHDVTDLRLAAEGVRRIE